MSEDGSSDVSDVVVEVHVPLIPDPSAGKDEYAYPWLLDLNEHFDQLDESDGETFDDGEEVGEDYIYFLTGQPESVLLKTASEAVRRTGVPPGAYAVVTTADAEEFGQGRRVDLPLG